MPAVPNAVAFEYMCFFSKLRMKIIILGAITLLSFTAINSNNTTATRTPNVRLQIGLKMRL